MYQSLLFYSGVPREEYDIRWKSFQAIKKAMENKLLGDKKHIRALLVDRAQLQHESRIVENNRRSVTQAHAQIYQGIPYGYFYCL